MAKKMNKKEQYAVYGIEYDTKTGHINSPIGFIPMLLVDGNDKIGKTDKKRGLDGVFHFSTVPGTFLYDVTINGKSFTVKGTCPCNCKGCYAMSGNYTRYGYDNVAWRTVIAREYTDFMVKAIIAQINVEGIKMCRIHASGDFFNDEYIAAWQEIVKACSGCVFWSYTKNSNAESAFDNYSNINIVKSVIKGYGFNFGKIEYILKVYKALKESGKSVYICRCGIDKNQHCNTCKGCSNHDYVLFTEHSTDYKAEKDPLYETIKEIIEQQPKQ